MPATRPEDLTDAAQILGVEDRGVVRAEPFGQWVIEDRFATLRPAWDRVGVQFVTDVKPFEDEAGCSMARTHSMAYLGYLAGYETIAETIADPRSRPQCVRCCARAETTLDPVPGTDLAAYQTQLIERFGNPANGHRCAQIAMRMARRRFRSAGWPLHASDLQSGGASTPLRSPPQAGFAISMARTNSISPSPSLTRSPVNSLRLRRSTLW